MVNHRARERTRQPRPNRVEYSQSPIRNRSSWHNCNRRKYNREYPGHRPTRRASFFLPNKTYYPFIPPIQPKIKEEKTDKHRNNEPRRLCDCQVTIKKLNTFHGPEIPANYAYFSRPAVFNLRKIYHTDPKDIFIVTYPKSGTTWTQKIVLLLLGLNDGWGTRDPNRIIPWIEERAANVNFVSWLLNSHKDKDVRYRVFKTHAEISKFPACTVNKESKIIYISRNPKDVITSWYSHHQAIERGGPRGILPFNRFFEICMNGGSPSGCWWMHNFFWSDAFKRNILCKNLLLVFEEMLANPAETILKLAKFLDVADSLTKEKLKFVLRESSFSKMKRDSKLLKWRYDKKFSSKFFRSGKVGRWKERLTQEQSRRIDERTKEWRKRGLRIPIYYEPLPFPEPRRQPGKNMEHSQVLLDSRLMKKRQPSLFVNTTNQS